MNKKDLLAMLSSVNKIKKGGQKIVYKAIYNGETVALKFINDSTDPRVIQEIAVVKELNIKNIPQIIESGVVYDEMICEDVLYIIEQYVAGISLRDWLNNDNKFNLRQAFDVTHTLIDIEIQLENEKILHRDINPNNIILADTGETYLIDFGLAKNLNGLSITQTAAAHGPFTPGYAPHEQIANVKYLQDVRTDLFQIGVTIYEACTGENPFISDNIPKIITRTLHYNPPLLVLKGDTKGSFAQFINMLMAKSPSQRPNSAVDAMRYLNVIKATLNWEG